MDLQQLLAQILNPNPGNRLANPIGDGMTQTGLGPDQLARYHAMSGIGGGAMPQAAPSAPSMPQAAPQTPDMQQTASVAAPAPSGGGIGGFLSNLMGGGAKAGENQTIQWLQGQGIDPGTATMMAKHKPALQAYLLQRSQGQKPIEVNGRLVDPNTYQVIADFSDKTPQNRQTAVIDGKLVDTNSGQVVGDYGSADDETSNIKEYEYAVKNNQFDGSFTDWQTKGVREQGKDFGRLQDVRKEIQQLPSYKNFAQAAPIYDTMLDASTRDSKAADLNLVYGLGKIFDPGSVVREGEMVMVKDTASLPDWLVGAINSLNGGARLQPETRNAILQEAKSRINSYKGMLDGDLTQYQKLAEQFELDPSLLIPNIPKIRDLPRPTTGNMPLPPPPAQAAPSGPVAPAAPAAPQGEIIDWRDLVAPGRKR